MATATMIIRWDFFITAMRSNAKAQRPPPETPGRLQESLKNYLNRPTALRGGGSLNLLLGGF
jgi:hypothetical protein